MKGSFKVTITEPLSFRDMQSFDRTSDPLDFEITWSETPLRFSFGAGRLDDGAPMAGPEEFPELCEQGEI